MPRRPSIQLRLSIFLTLIILLTAVIAGIASFFTMFSEARELQDDLLRQTAILIQQPADAGYADIDSDIRIYIQPLNEKHRFNLPNDVDEGFYDITDKKKNDPYRAYVHTYPDGQRVAFIQETEFRDDVAADSAWYAVMPLLILAPIALLLTALIIYLTLRPVRQLSAQTENRNENDLSPLPTEQIPREIYGFAEAVNRLLERVGEGVRQQQRFIADAAHELRSPMTALSLQAERLSTRDLPEGTAFLVEDLREGIRRNRRLLEQLLSMARMQTEEERPRENINISRLYQQLIQDVYPLADAKNIDIGTDVGNENVHVFANETEIYTLMKTLTENAICYTPEGGQIDLHARRNNSGCVLEIEDSGNGIPPDERTRVFDPFYRILGNDTEGSGLGLSIAQTIAKRYGGRITLSDAKQFPSGLNVSVWLPLQEAPK